MSGKPVTRRSLSQAPAPRQGRRASSLAATTTPQLSAQAGPVMLSAPHGHELYRGGGETGERERIHRREQWTTELVLRLAMRVDELVAAKLKVHLGQQPNTTTPREASVAAAAAGMTPPARVAERDCDAPPSPPQPLAAAATPRGTTSGFTFRRPLPRPGRAAPQPTPHCSSFVVWNSMAARPLDRTLKDPNYLRTCDFPTSPWNQSLRSFQRHCAATFPAGTVPLHVDVHGKLNRKDNFELDVGIESLHELWAPQSGPLAQRCALMKSVVSKHFARVAAACPTTHNGYAASVEVDPDLHGYWGNPEAGAPVTMTTQAALLGIHTMQLELPHDMRRCLAAKRATASLAFFEAFAAGIADTFIDLQPAEVLPELAAWYAQQTNIAQHCGAARVAATELLTATEKFFVTSQLRHI